MASSSVKAKTVFGVLLVGVIGAFALPPAKAPLAPALRLERQPVSLDVPPHRVPRHTKFWDLHKLGIKPPPEDLTRIEELNRRLIEMRENYKGLRAASRKKIGWFAKLIGTKKRREAAKNSAYQDLLEVEAEMNSLENMPFIKPGYERLYNDLFPKLDAEMAANGFFPRERESDSEGILRDLEAEDEQLDDDDFATPKRRAVMARIYRKKLPDGGLHSIQVVIDYKTGEILKEETLIWDKDGNSNISDDNENCRSCHSSNPIAHERKNNTLKGDKIILQILKGEIDFLER